MTTNTDGAPDPVAEARQRRAQLFRALFEWEIAHGAETHFSQVLCDAVFAIWPERKGKGRRDSVVAAPDDSVWVIETEGTRVKARRVTDALVEHARRGPLGGVPPNACDMVDPTTDRRCAHPALWEIATQPPHPEGVWAYACSDHIGALCARAMSGGVSVTFTLRPCVALALGEASS